MTPALQEYLVSHSFVEATASDNVQPSVSTREYVNGQFRIRIVNERSSEMYVQVGPAAGAGTYHFLNGVVAFLTSNDAATRVSGQAAERLVQHHEDITRLFAASPDGEARRERFALWQSEFAAREQVRLAADASGATAARKRWWKLW